MPKQLKKMHALFTTVRAATSSTVAIASSVSPLKQCSSQGVPQNYLKKVLNISIISPFYFKD